MAWRAEAYRLTARSGILETRDYVTHDFFNSRGMACWEVCYLTMTLIDHYTSLCRHCIAFGEDDLRLYTLKCLSFRRMLPQYCSTSVTH